MEGMGRASHRSRPPGTRLCRWRRRPLSEAAGGGESAPGSLAGEWGDRLLFQARPGLACPLGGRERESPARGPLDPQDRRACFVVDILLIRCAVLERLEILIPSRKFFSTEQLGDFGFSKDHHTVEATHPEMLT